MSGIGRTRPELTLNVKNYQQVINEIFLLFELVYYG